MRMVSGRISNVCFITAVVVVFCASCATQKTAAPLFSTLRTPKDLEPPRLIEVRNPPDITSSIILINIPQEKTTVAPEDSVMRKGAIIKAGASVVISVPVASESKTPGGGFRTDGYFHELEHHIERGLLSVGIQVKDRAKFEAKMRGRISDDTSKSASSGKVALLSDIAEVIRAAQDGEIMADYILQVNDISVTPYSGTPLQLGAFKEVRTALDANPSLRIGGEAGKSLPTTIPQPWWQARFNAKLIDTKTGSIEWAGEYTVDSLSVLEKGISIGIRVRRKITNAQAVADAENIYNSSISDAYQRALSTRQELAEEYNNAMKPIRYEGTTVSGDKIQSDRSVKVEKAERTYEQALTAYQDARRRDSAAARAEWLFDYDVDAPLVKPNLTNPQTDDERIMLLEHINLLGFTVVHELFATIKVE